MSKISENIEELKDLREGFKDPGTWEREFLNKLDVGNLILYYLIPILEDFEKQLKIIEVELGIYAEKEIKKIKVGGTDPD